MAATAAGVSVSGGEPPASAVRGDRFPAIAGDHCRDCAFVPLCPIKGAGPVVAQ